MWDLVLRSLRPCIFAVLAILPLFTTPAVGQSTPKVDMPDANKILLLVRSSILTLNDAVQTGNYTVLRDRATPSFRRANTASRLSQIFAGLERSKLDLAAVSTMVPKLTKAPQLRKNNQLALTGHFLSPPIRIDFNLTFHPVAGVWRLHGIAVNPVKIAAKNSTTN